MSRPASVLLSTRELQVLKAVADGLTATQIGEQLFLSRETVRSHLRKLRNKLGAANRPHAVALAVMSGELVLPTSPNRHQ